MHRSDQDSDLGKGRRSDEVRRREEEWGAAFCYALNRLHLEQEGYRLQPDEHTCAARRRTEPRERLHK